MFTKVICVVIFLLACFPFLSAQHYQEELCGTEYSADPEFDHNEFEAFRRSLRLETRSVAILPFKAHIVRHSDGSGGFKAELVQEAIDTMNQYFVRAGIMFELSGEVSYIEKDILYDFDRSRYQDSLIKNSLPGVMNVYFINKVLNDDASLCGYAQFPWNPGDYVVVKNSCAQNGSTLAHEVGHYLGLFHTHETARGIELVERTNCRVSGDELCDTPADPRLGNSTVNLDCEYIGNFRDLDGKRYSPDPRNIMSYSRKECRDFFTRGQLERMLYYLERDRTYLSPLASQNSNLSKRFFKLYPNPASDKLILSSKVSMYKDAMIRLINNNGQTIRTLYWSQDGRLGEKQIDISDLSKGLYQLLVQYDKSINTFSFIKG